MFPDALPIAPLTCVSARPLFRVSSIEWQGKAHKIELQPALPTAGHRSEINVLKSSIYVLTFHFSLSLFLEYLSAPGSCWLSISIRYAGVCRMTSFFGRLVTFAVF
jgi:hypothetical protein